MSSFLITGGAGFIGTHLARRLIQQGRQVRVLDLVSPPDPVPDVQYLVGDVTRAQTLLPAMAGVDAVFHLAAIVSVPRCQEGPSESYLTNFTGTVNVLEAARGVGVATGRMPRFVMASSAAVYGDLGRENEPLRESLSLQAPLSFYGAQKLASEHAVLRYSRDLGLPALSFRFFNVFGAGQDASSPYSGVISLFAREASAKRPLRILGDGNQTRDFVAVEDLVEACTRVLDLNPSRLQGQAINLGMGKAIRIRELAEIMRRITRLEASIESGPARGGDVRHSLADVSEASALLGWKATVDLETGLGRMIHRV